MRSGGRAEAGIVAILRADEIFAVPRALGVKPPVAGTPMFQDFVKVAQ